MPTLEPWPTTHDAPTHLIKTWTQGSGSSVVWAPLTLPWMEGSKIILAPPSMDAVRSGLLFCQPPLLGRRAITINNIYLSTATTGL